MSLPTARLGTTDVDITRVGFGAWALGGGSWVFGWGTQDDQDRRRPGSGTPMSA
jgi:aryl-alcohol dehydrogenase-like predicted oxidoreductase